MSDQLELEIELLEATLLPTEHLTTTSEWPRELTITSDESDLSIRVTLQEAYPNVGAVAVEVKGREMGREDAQGWKDWVNSRMTEWDASEEYPLYQLLTGHFIPILAPSSRSPSPPPAPATTAKVDDTPHHALLISHHLLAPSKRKDLVALSSQLSLVGFAKTGHPGIMYSIGSKVDLEEWVREVKTWQWLALRVRVTPEPLATDDSGKDGPPLGKGKEEGARGGKGRGEWVELEKVGEAVEWLRKRGQDGLLTSFGIGMGKEER